MASPQKEKGFTPIAHEILERVALCKFNGSQLRIILIVWRFTYGFQRKQHEFSLTFLSKAANIHKNQVNKELNILIDNKVLKVRSEATYTTSRVISFNKNYDEWSLNYDLPVSELSDSQLVNRVTPPVSEFTNQDIKSSLKKILKKDIVLEDGENMKPTIEDYKAIINYLNEKSGKNFSYKTKPTQAFINGRFSEGHSLEAFYQVINVKCSHWLGEEHEMYLRPQTLFSPSKFESYLNQKMGKPSIKSKFETDKEKLLKMYAEESENEENGDREVIHGNTCRTLQL